MSTAPFRFRISRVDVLAENIIYLKGELLSGEIQPECSGFVGSEGQEIFIKGVVLVHPPDRPADEVTLFVETIPLDAKALVGKLISSTPI